MIPVDVLAAWPRLWQHPELFAAVQRAEPPADASAVESVLRALATEPDVAQSARVLLDSGEWQLADELLRVAPVAVADELREEVRTEHGRWLSDTEVRAEALAARAAALGVEVAAPMLDATARRHPTDEALAAEDERLRAAEADALAALEREAVARAAEDAWRPGRMAALQEARRRRRITVARALVADDRAYAAADAAWPARRGAEHVAVPELFPPRPPWPWPGRDVRECLSWFLGGRVPPGFGGKWRPPAGDEDAAAILQRLQEAAAAEAPARDAAFAAALAHALAAELSEDSKQLSLGDTRLVMFGPLTGPLEIGHHERLNTRAGIVLRSPAGVEVVVTWGDLLASLGAHGQRRVHLLRVLGSQLPPGVAQGSTAGWPDDACHSYVEWRFDLLGLAPEAGVVETVVGLAAGRTELAEALLGEAADAAGTLGVASVAAVESGWRSPTFHARARPAVSAGLSDVAERLLRVAAMLDVGAVAAEEVQTLLEFTGPVEPAVDARDVLAALERTRLAIRAGGQLEIPAAVRRLVRRTLPLQL